jgi:hypothetical protein
MFIRITRDFSADICNHDPEKNVDWIIPRRFQAGEVFVVDEVSAIDKVTTVLELRGIGFVEAPNIAWVYCERIRYHFLPDTFSRN